MASIPVRIEARFPRRLGAIVGAAFALVVVAALLAANIVSVDVGEAVAIVDPIAGRIVGVVFGPALALKAPWQYTKEVYVAVSTLTFRADQGTAIDALTKDGARISVDVTVRYEIRRDPEVIRFLVTKYAIAPRDEIERNVITPIVRQVVRDVIARYTLTEVIERREELSYIIVEALRQRLQEDETIRLAVDIIDIAVRRIMPPQSVLDAIEAKLRAQQEALAAQYQLQKQITLANATRMRMIIEAQGEMEARVVRAKGEVEAIKLLSEALGNRTDLLIAYLFVQNLARYNGTLIVVLVPSANQTIPFLMVPSVRG
jgi:regulator of protease activity HflC (stomatin/prohibitin superfamily)